MRKLILIIYCLLAAFAVQAQHEKRPKYRLARWEYLGLTYHKKYKTDSAKLVLGLKYRYPDFHYMAKNVTVKINGVKQNITYRPASVEQQVLLRTTAHYYDTLEVIFPGRNQYKQFPLELTFDGRTAELLQDIDYPPLISIKEVLR